MPCRLSLMGFGVSSAPVFCLLGLARVTGITSVKSANSLRLPICGAGPFNTPGWEPVSLKHSNSWASVSTNSICTMMLVGSLLSVKGGV